MEPGRPPYRPDRRPADRRGSRAGAGSRRSGWPAGRFALVLTSPLLPRPRHVRGWPGSATRRRSSPTCRSSTTATTRGSPRRRSARRGPGWNLWRDGAPNGERPEDVGVRADRVIARALEAGGDVALFAHGHVLRVLAARWIELGPAYGGHLALGTASMSELGYERERRAIWLWNDPATCDRPDRAAARRARPRPRTRKELLPLLGDPRVGATLGGVLTPARCAPRASAWRSTGRSHGFGYWVWRETATGALRRPRRARTTRTSAGARRSRSAGRSWPTAGARASRPSRPRVRAPRLRARSAARRGRLHAGRQPRLAARDGEARVPLRARRRCTPVCPTCCAGSRPAVWLTVRLRVGDGFARLTESAYLNGTEA